MFVVPSYAESQEYREFWRKLNDGQFQVAEFERVGKNNREVWIEASYNPIIDDKGRPYKVVKYATDVSKKKREYADLLGKINAISRSQAVIEFNIDGSIITANQNFLDALGYSADEIRGKHHRIFMDPAQAASPDYARFWQNLAAGQFQSGQFKRIGKDGREIWIEASYNPVFDLKGKPLKIVKFATDITQQIRLLADLKKIIDVNFSNIDTAVGRSLNQAEQAADATNKTSSSVQTVASSTEELAASINAIAQGMGESRQATDTAFQQVTAAGDETQKLSDATAAMGDIVGLIQNIASQINLLALNATIESARAGEAGKGFAVVANEVKNLANQAAKATEQISQEIEGIQAISDKVVSALGGISGSIESVREHVSATASAVEQQSAVTHEMSATMQGVADAVESITRNVSDIAATVRQVEGAVGETKKAASILTR